MAAVGIGAHHIDTAAARKAGRCDAPDLELLDRPGALHRRNELVVGHRVGKANFRVVVTVGQRRRG